MLCLLFGPLQAQSPWVPGQGNGLLSTNLSAILPYNATFNAGGEDRLYNKQVLDMTLGIYGEYGVTERLAFIGNLPLKYLSTTAYSGESCSTCAFTATEGNIAGLANTTFGAKYVLYNKGLIVSSQFTIDAPTGRFDNATALRTGYNDWGFTPMVSIGAGLGNAYVYGYGGLQFTTGNISHGTNSGFEAGYGFFKKRFYLAVGSNVRLSLNNVPNTEPIDNIYNALYVNNQEWVSMYVKLLYMLKTDQTGIQFVFGGAPYANQSAIAPSLNIGFFNKFIQERTVTIVPSF